MHIDGVTRVGLDEDLKGAGGREEFLGGGGDGRDGGVAGCSAVASAEDEVFVCVELVCGFIGKRGWEWWRERTSGDDLHGAGELWGAWWATVDGEELAEGVGHLVGFGVGEDLRVEIAWVEEGVL